jgi:surface protein
MDKILKSKKRIDLKDKGYSLETKKHLKRFERLNTTTKSIFDLGSHDVLIIIDGGKNLTSWDDVDHKNEVLYVSENLSGCDNSVLGKYNGLNNAHLIIAQNLPSTIKFADKMFKGCKKLIDVVGFETWNTSNLVDMRGMFTECESLVSVNGLKYLDVSNVKCMNEVFIHCKSLKDISFLKDWNTSNVKEMMGLFGDCCSLKDTSPLKNWDVSNVKNMDGVFADCKSLANLEGLRLWDVSSVETFNTMFWGCRKLTNVNALKDWNTCNVRVFSRMFRACKSLKDISGLANWDLSSAKEMTYTFIYCESLKDLSPLSHWDVSNVSNMRSMFDNCESIETLSGLENWDLANVSTVERMFDSCTSLSDVSALESWNLANNVIAGDIFVNCPKVKENPLKKEFDKTKPIGVIDYDNVFFLDIYGSGWCLVKLGDVYSRASYITDVPYDCLESILTAIMEDEDFYVKFDAEGWSFEVRADNEQCYFNFLPGEKHAFDTMNKYDLAILIYQDISGDSSWHGWSRQNLNPLLEKLKTIIDNDFKV